MESNLLNADVIRENIIKFYMDNISNEDNDEKNKFIDDVTNYIKKFNEYLKNQGPYSDSNYEIVIKDNQELLNFINKNSLLFHKYLYENNIENQYFQDIYAYPETYIGYKLLEKYFFNYNIYIYSKIKMNEEDFKKFFDNNYDKLYYWEDDTWINDNIINYLLSDYKNISINDQILSKFNEKYKIYKSLNK